VSESSLRGTFACAGASAAGSQIAAIGPILNEIVDRFGRGQRVTVDQALSFDNEAINVGARVGNDALERIATQAKPSHGYACGRNRRRTFNWICGSPKLGTDCEPFASYQ
jgi:hypothetical protein